MECSLERASEQFQEMIENKRSNLSYLKQLNATYESSQSGTWGKTVALVTDFVTDVLGEDAQSLIEGDLSFESLKNMIQVVTLVKPEVFAVALKREINKMEEYFAGELETFEVLEDYLEEAIDKLSNEWSELTQENLPILEKYELNELMNEKVPESGTQIDDVKSELIRLEADVYNDNTTEELTRGKITELINDLQQAKNNLENPSEGNIILNLIALLSIWERIEGLIKSLKTPSSQEFQSMADLFKLIGDNFKESVEQMLMTLRTIREAIMDIDNVSSMMEYDWIDSVKPLIKNSEDYQGATALKLALDRYIQHETPQEINVNYPVIATMITSNTFKKWEREANIAKLNKSTWINLINDAISKLRSITESNSNVILAYDDIYEPLGDDIIDAYVEVSAPYWGELFKKFNEVYTIIQLMTDGVEVSKDIKTGMQELLDKVRLVKDVILAKRNIFTDEDPAGAINAMLSLTNTANGVVNGLTVMSDYLGYDHMSELIRNNKFKELIDLEKENADTTQQLLNDLTCLKESSDLTKSIGVEIRKMVMAEKQRKERLRTDTTLLIAQGIDRKEQEITTMQSMNDKFRNNI